MAWCWFNATESKPQNVSTHLKKLMGIFSMFKKKGRFNLSKSDFKTENEDFEVISVKLSDDFFDLFPEAKKKKKYTGKNTLVTNLTKISLFGNEVEITYYPNEIELNENAFIELINQKLNWISENEEIVKNGIAKKLVLLKNKNWLNKNKIEISNNEFIERIKLESISFLSHGNSELSFNDDGIFSEHKITAELNLKNELINIKISG